MHYGAAAHGAAGTGTLAVTGAVSTGSMILGVVAAAMLIASAVLLIVHRRRRQGARP